jgi:hypothetical protein
MDGTADTALTEVLMTGLVGVGLLMASAVGGQVVPGAAPMPLVVEQVQIVPARSGKGREVEVTIFNRGPRTIHAWGIRIEATTAEGRPTTGGLSTDAYDSESTRPDSGPLQPGGRRTVHPGGYWPEGKEPTILSLTVEPKFLIFDDNTAIGDEQEIEHYFQRRARNRRAWPVLEKILAGATAAEGDPLLRLVQVQDELAGLQDGEAKASDAGQWLDRMLSMNLKIRSLDHAAFLERLMTSVQARKAAAERHYQRRW